MHRDFKILIPLGCPTTGTAGHSGGSTLNITWSIGSMSPNGLMVGTRKLSQLVKTTAHSGLFFVEQTPQLSTPLRA